MKKNIMIVFLFVISLSAIQAQLLWKITGKGLKHPSYLFGTHHLIPIQFLDSVPGLFKSFNECETMVGEMVLNNIDVSAKIQQAARLPNHIKMSDLLSNDDYKLVDLELKSVLKFGLKDVSVMNPTLILTLYQMEIYKKMTGLTDDKQSDSYFQLIAEAKDKKVIGLETVDQQIKILFGNSDYNRQALILVQTIRKKKEILYDMLELNKLYKAGKIEELIEFSKGKGNITDMTVEEYTNLVDKRNDDWISKLPTMMNQNSCFIAVGAMHLGGKNGLIKLLEKEGYKVSSILN